MKKHWAESNTGIYIIYPLTMFLVALLWFAVTSNLTFEIVDRILSIAAIYYFLMHLYDYLRSKKQDNKNTSTQKNAHTT